MQLSFDEYVEKNRAESFSNLERLDYLTKRDLRLLQLIVSNEVDLRELLKVTRKLETIDKVLDTHGVELITLHQEDEERIIEYLNTGDSYAPTICLCEGRLFVSDWGTIVEDYQERYEETNEEEEA